MYKYSIIYFVLLFNSFSHMQTLLEGDSKDMLQEPVVKIPMFTLVKSYQLWLVWASFS